MNKLLKVLIPILLILGLVLISGCGASPSELPSIPGEEGRGEESYVPAPADGGRGESWIPAVFR